MPEVKNTAAEMRDASHGPIKDWSQMRKEPLSQRMYEQNLITEMQRE